MSGNAKKQQTVLILGSGLVSRPAVHYLSVHFRVWVGSRTLDKAAQVCSGAQNATAKQIDVETAEGMAAVDALLPEVDAVLSLLPYLFHVQVAKLAIKHRKHFFTTSYVSPEMAALEESAKASNVILLNECGVDPGTDHMSAMRLIDHARANGGRVRFFTSYCGGLPAPADNDNPFGYKFSWAPRGVLLASKNPAKWLQDGNVESIAAGELFDHFTIEHVDAVQGVTEFECYPNRDSTQYKDVYNLQYIETLQRGTFRYKGWCEKIRKLSDLGYLSLDARPTLPGRTMRSVTAELVGAPLDGTAEVVRDAVAAKLQLAADSSILGAFAWVGLFSDDKIKNGVTTVLDALCAEMMARMVYAEGQRDMLLMVHKYKIEYDDRVEHLSTTMVDYGVPNGDSSMSRTVSLPVAICIRLVLQNQLKLEPGLHRPLTRDIYGPILDELARFNIHYVDKLLKTEPRTAPQQQ